MKLTDERIRKIREINSSAMSATFLTAIAELLNERWEWKNEVERLRKCKESTIESMPCPECTKLQDRLGALAINVQEGLILCEGEIAVEQLAGNIVKAEFWFGERSAYRQVEAKLDAGKVGGQ